MAVCRRNVAEYFVVVGLDETSQRFDAADSGIEANSGSTSESNDDGPEQMELPTAAEPITELSVVFTGAGEKLPPGYECITITPSQHPASLYHGSATSNKTFYVCYRRGRDTAPLTDIE